MSKYDEEKKAQLEELKEKLKNPLFRAANTGLVKKIERDIREEEAAERIRKYLRDENPGATFAQVIINTRVDMKILEQLIADGRVDMKISDKDWAQLDEEQKKLVKKLTTAGDILQDKQDIKQRRMEGNSISASGMYSNKEHLK